jgi:DNA polymerase-3 subunit alpha
VNAQGNIRFGMAAVKGIGANAVDLIVEERKANGPFTTIFNFVERLSSTATNRKIVVALALSGAFDDFSEIKRHQFFALNSKDELFIDNLLRYGNRIQADRVMNANSLFGDTHAVEVSKPEIPAAPEWSATELLKKEKELIGMYLSAHPIDTFKFEMKHFTTNQLTEVDELNDTATTSASIRNKAITFGGIVINVQHKISQKSGKPWGSFTLEDYSGVHQFTLFGKDYETFLKYLHLGHALLVRCGFQQRFQQDNKEDAPWELRVKSISLLSMAREELVHRLQITLAVNEINKTFTDCLVEKAKNNKGKVDLCLKIIDPDENIAVELFSRPYRIALNPDFLQFIEEENLNIVIS